jgi:methyl-accepting chemotaxis protein
MAVAAATLQKMAKEETGTVQVQVSSTISGSSFTLLVGTGFIFVVGVIVSVLLARSITGPLGRLTLAMTALAGGDRSATVQDAERRDEIGAMAKAVQVFKDNAVQMERLRVEQEESKASAATRQKAALNQLADTFEANVGGIVGSVSSAATEMEGAAQSMTATAEETSRQTTAVAAAANQASTNVQTVATAAEELASSIQEIGRQVAQSSKIAEEAVSQANYTNTTVEGLTQAAQRIGEVVGLIQDIAGQTNLLALSATSAAVTAIQSIGSTIGRISEITVTISSAVEQQGAATQEIARNVQQAAQGTEEVTSNISGVTQASGEVGAAATQVLGSAGELSKQSERLRQEVDSFLATVRAA